MAYLRSRPGDMERAGLLRWLWYAMGGGLPPAHRRWVLLILVFLPVAGFARGTVKAVRDQADAGTREAAAERYRGGESPTRRNSE